MLHKGFGGMAGLGAAAFIGFAAPALQGGASSTRSEWLWVASVLALVLAVAGGIGWVLTRAEAAHDPLPSVTAKAGRDNAYAAGRDQIIVHPPAQAPQFGRDRLERRMAEWDDQALRREIDELTAFSARAAELAKHPGNEPHIWFAGDEETERDRQVWASRAELETLGNQWSESVREWLAKNHREYLAEWDAEQDAQRPAILIAIIKELRAKL